MTSDGTDLVPAGSARGTVSSALALQQLVRTGGLRALLRRQVTLEVYGLDELRTGPAVVVANHSSPLDTAVLLASLPDRRRRATAVARPDDEHPSGPLLTAIARLGVTAAPADPDTPPATLLARLAAGGTVLGYPDGPATPDGFSGALPLGAARLALAAGVAIVPVGVRGSYAATPQGLQRPIGSRPRVSVRYGAPIHPQAGESAVALAERAMTAVRRLVEEDATSWWQVQRTPGSTAAEPTASWRRIWAQTEVPVAGHRPRRAKIWRR